MAAPDWKGLFEWSMKYQDGTQPAAEPQPMDEGKRKWLEEAMEHMSQNLSKRMKDIKAVLDDSGDSAAVVDEKERLLDELCEIVEDIDFARDLAVIGGLPTLLSLLGSSHAVLRAKAAEVVATAVQNNPPVQQWFMEGGALPPLMDLMHNCDSMCRTKALLALSSMVRHNPDALRQFTAGAGVTSLINIVQDDDLRNQRKAMQLLGYVAREREDAVTEPLRDGTLLPLLGAHLTGRDRSAQTAALSTLCDFAHQPSALLAMKQDTNLQQQLASTEVALKACTGEDAEAVQDELVLCERLSRLLAATVVREVRQQGAAYRDPGAPTPDDMRLAIV